MMGARTSSPQERTRGGQAADYTGRRSPGEASGGIHSAIRWREVGNGVDRERQWGRISIVAIRVWRLDAGGMARALRVDVAGAWYHFMNQGIGEKRCFGTTRIGSGFWARWRSCRLGRVRENPCGSVTARRSVVATVNHLDTTPLQFSGSSSISSRRDDGRTESRNQCMLKHCGGVSQSKRSPLMCDGYCVWHLLSFTLSPGPTPGGSVLIYLTRRWLTWMFQ